MESQNEQSPIAKAASNIPNPEPKDALLIYLKAGLNYGGAHGSALASLVGDYIQIGQQRRIKEFAEAVSKEFDRLESMIPGEKILTDDYAFLVQEVLPRAAKEHRELKIEALRNMLINALLVDVDLSRQESYLKCLDSLTPMHLFLLNRMTDAQYVLDKSETMVTGRSQFAFTSRMRVLEVVFGDQGYTSDDFAMVAHDLDAYGITNNLVDSLHGTSSIDGCRDFSGILTPYGRSFLAFISRSAQ